MGQIESSVQSTDFEVHQAIEAELEEAEATEYNDAAVVTDEMNSSDSEVRMNAEESVSPQLPSRRLELNSSHRNDDKSYDASKTSHGIDDQATDFHVREKIHPGTAVHSVVCEGEVDGWVHVSLTSAAMRAVQAHPGIEAVKVEDSEFFQDQELDVVEPPPEVNVAEKFINETEMPQAANGYSRRTRRNSSSYIVFPKMPDGSTDTKATEAFLRSKIQPGTNMYHFSDDVHVTAWWGLRLDPDAKVAVENHEAVGRIIEDPGTNYSRAS